MSVRHRTNIIDEESFWNDYCEIIIEEYKINEDEMMDQLLFSGLTGDEQCGVRIHSEGTKDGKTYNFTFNIQREDEDFHIIYVGRTEE